MQRHYHQGRPADQRELNTKFKVRLRGPTCGHAPLHTGQALTSPARRPPRRSSSSWARARMGPCCKCSAWGMARRTRSRWGAVACPQRQRPPCL